jgi:3-(3-hydroxy-phenyl)propionate hydroxylase
MAASKASARVVIVGAGPVGMVCALALNRSGISVTVFEQEPEPPIEQRAATIHPSTLEMLDELGVTKKVIPLGLISNAYRFHDRVTNDVVAEFNLDLMRDEFRYPFALQYEQYKMTASIAAEYANAGDFDVRFSHSITGLTQGADDVEIEIDTPDGPARMRADYVIGCDGGRSSVRKGADIGFEGFTYPERFIKIATPFDVATLNRNLVLRNYFSDPFEWCNLFKVRGEEPGGLWRAIFPLQEGEDEETALLPEQVEARLQKFFPKPGEYETRYVNVYGVHQRVASTFRLGRVLLAGDSAHLNNPIGGMGMNGGIHDGLNLAEKLARVIHGEAGDELLDLYSRQRRHAAVKYVQAQTIANKRLMEERDPAVRKTNFDELRRTADNPETAKAYMRRAALFDSLRDAAAVT